MRSLSITLFLFLSLITSFFSVAFQVSDGSLLRIQQFQSQYVAAKDVFIWLPPGYNNEQRYAVLYMHDGQMLFDASQTWNKQEWGVDEVAGKLMREQSANTIQPFIVVAATNADFFGKGQRMNEYFPQKATQYLQPKQLEEMLALQRGPEQPLFRGELFADQYLAFLVKELKPYIDKTFSVYTDAQNTAIMGSSMGGLISMYAMSEYPDVFGKAACLSTHWVGAIPRDNNPLPQALFDYVQEHFPKAGKHKVYFDFGNKTLDQYYPPLQAAVDELIRAKGYSDENWQTQFFEGAKHDEISWQARLHIPLTFLFKK